MIVTHYEMLQKKLHTYLKNVHTGFSDKSAEQE